MGVSGLLLEPAGYAELLEQLKARVRTSQVRAARAANSELLGLYWSVGRDILDRQEQAGWGSRVIDRLATDLRAEFPDQRGWSRSNLHYMRSLAAAWPDTEVVPQAVGQLPWGHVRVLLDKLSTRQERDWYATAVGEYGWSRDVLAQQVKLGWPGGSGRRRRTSRPRCRRRTRSWRSSWCATRTCSTTWCCPAGSWSASLSRR